MKNVYFVQANMTYGKAMYLPYATGCLAAYAWQFEEIQKEFKIGEFIYKRENVNKVLERIENPAIVAFSCYTWTFEYNKTLAKMVKEKFPECVILFGGHNVSEESDLLSQLDFVDVLIYGEGEHPFKDILLWINGKRYLKDISNIAFRNENEIITTKREYFTDIENYPSPYLLGYFENITEQNPNIEFCAVVETNRGCPYQCAYCDWCYSADLRQFPIERVKGDIEWCGTHRIEYIFCADSNFGILKRDFDIAKYVVEVKKKHSYPHIFNTCFAKNSNDVVFEISKLFYDNKLNKAATLAYQSVCDEALANVNRKNFNLEAFSSLVNKYNEHNMPTYTEMILGLPGETYDSFCDGLCSLMDAGQQSALTVYYCQVYCNALMGSKAYKEKFGIKTAHVPLNYLHSSMPKEEDITEYTDLVIETNTLTFEDMVKSILFCTCLQCFHHIGLLKFFAMYVKYENNVSFRDFYTSLLEYILNAKGTRINQIFERTKKECSDFSNGEWSYYNPKFGEIGWFLEEGIYMEIICEFDSFWNDIIPFLKRFDIEEGIFNELLSFQKFTVRLPNQEKLSKEFEYDFIEYFDKVLYDYNKLKKSKIRIDITIPNPVYDWKTYAREVMLFAKRRGDTIVINDKRYMNVTCLGEV